MLLPHPRVANSAIGELPKFGGDACSRFFPVGQRHQFVQDVLQSLQPTLMIPP